MGKVFNPVGIEYFINMNYKNHWIFHFDNQHNFISSGKVIFHFHFLLSANKRVCVCELNKLANVVEGEKQERKSDDDEELVILLQELFTEFSCDDVWEFSSTMEISSN